MQVKTTIKYHCSAARIAKIILSIKENVEQMDLLYTASGSAKWRPGKYLVVPYKVKYT